MYKFKDSKNREWNIELNLGVLKQAKKDTGFDFYAKENNDNPLLSLAGDYIMLADVLCSLVSSQLEKANVTPEDFLTALTGDSIDAATDAIAGAYIDSLPLGKRRDVMKTLWAKVRETEQIALDKAAIEVEKINPATFGA